MLSPEPPDHIHVAFDDHHLVANAGLTGPTAALRWIRAKEPTVSPAQGFGHFTSVCHSSDEIRPPNHQAESSATRAMKPSPSVDDAGRHRSTGRSARVRQFSKTSPPATNLTNWGTFITSTPCPHLTPNDNCLVSGVTRVVDHGVISGNAAGTPTCPAAMRQDAANIQAGICAVDHVACVGNCRLSNRLISRVRQNSPRTRLLASNRMMLHQSHCRLVSKPKAENASEDSIRGSPWPQRKDFGHSPAFAICLMARDGKPEGTQDWMVPCTTAKHQFAMANINA